MGDIREMENIMTCERWYETNGVKYDAFRMAFHEIGLEDFAKKRVLTHDEILRIEAYPFRKTNNNGKSKQSTKNGRKKNNPQRSNSTPRPVKKVNTRRAGSWEWPRLELADFLALAVYGHTFLVWYEVAVIFALPGILSGVVVFALKHAAVTICRKEKFTGISDDALAVAFVLDGLAWYAHYTVFSDALPQRLVDQMGNGAFWTAVVLGGVVAAGAWVSLLLIKKITVNKMWQ